MKKIQLLIIVALLLSAPIYAQTWMSSIKTANPSFFEIQKAFYENYKPQTASTTGKDEKEDGEFEKFKRWEWYWKPRVSKSGEFPPNNVLFTEWEKYQEAHNLSKSANRTTSISGSWTFQGPTLSTAAIDGTGVGRVACIAFHPTDANTYWVGTPAGGLWKTTDDGAHWSTNTDNLPVLGVSDIAIDPTNVNHMYIATGDMDGEFSGGGGDTKSVGVLQSTDGGATWNPTGLSWTLSATNFIRMLKMDPTNPAILFAASNVGIFKTTDGGTTWTNVLTTALGAIEDIEFKPTDHNTMYASEYGTDLYKSIDNGNTWTNVQTISGAGRIKLAVSAAAPNDVDALVDKSTDYSLLGLYRSIDNGSTYNMYWDGNCTLSQNLLGNHYDGADCYGQGFYDLAFDRNPSNANEIYVGGVNTWKSSDGGASWTLNDFWSPGGTPGPTPITHADKHWLVHHPLVPGTLFECNDGGVYKTTNGGATWTDLSSGLGNAEIYRISPAATVANDVICGFQDNGTKENNSSIWNNRTGGDGTTCIIDYTNSNIQYASYVQGVIYQTTDDWAFTSSTLVNSGGTGVNTNGSWVTPFLIHPTNHNTLIVGKDQVYQSTDAGVTWAQLGTIPGLTNTLDAMAYAPSTPITIYVSAFNALYKTTDGGATWSNVPISITFSHAITHITVDPSSSLNLWITLSAYDAGIKVLNSTDGGATWTNISGTLPNVPANCLVYENSPSQVLYVGTDLGVYYKCISCGMSDWLPFNTGLPNVVVNDLEISAFDNTLWAGTYGRGLWKSSLYSTVEVANQNKASNVEIAPNPSKGLFTVKFADVTKATIQVFDLYGRALLSNNINDSKSILDLTNYANGVYFLKISSEEINETKKILLAK